MAKEDLTPEEIEEMRAIVDDLDKLTKRLDNIRLGKFPKYREGLSQIRRALDYHSGALENLADAINGGPCIEGRKG